MTLMANTAEQMEVFGYTPEGLDQEVEKYAGEAKEDFAENKLEEERRANHPLNNVPFFQRPVNASTDDIEVPTSDPDVRAFKNKFGETYTIATSSDQRVEREKLRDGIISSLEGVKGYLENPFLPNKEQVADFVKGAAVGTLEQIKQSMESGATYGDIFGTLAGVGAASTPFKVPEGSLRLFGGVSMKGAAKDKNLKKAIGLLKDSDFYKFNRPASKEGGISYDLNKKIWSQTGWYVDPADGQWRYFIDDTKASLKNLDQVSNLGVSPDARNPNIFKNVKISDVFDHPEFYKRYPEFKDLEVRFFNADSKKGDNLKLLGSYDEVDNVFSINLGADAHRSMVNGKYITNIDKLKKTVLHELQHVIQKKESFVRGTSSGDIPPDLVYNKDRELRGKKKPISKKFDEAEKELKLTSIQLTKAQKKARDNPLPGLTTKQEIEIYNKHYSKPDELKQDVTWASTAREYGVPVSIIQKAANRTNLIGRLNRKRIEQRLVSGKLADDVYDVDRERSKIETYFYEGAGGEIEARLTEEMLDPSMTIAQLESGATAKDIFPVDARAGMLEKEGNMYQYQGKYGVDPFEYEIKPRREPESTNIIKNLKKRVGLSDSVKHERWRTDIEPEVYDAFHELAMVQRGKPERAMTDLAISGGGGVMGHAAEHIGDLTHRMAEYGGKFGSEYVKPKVDKMLKLITNEYGFRKEFLENLENNAKYFHKENKINKPFEEYKSRFIRNNLLNLEKYAEEHKKVPVYNELQLAAREAAVSLGEQRFYDVEKNLLILKDAIDNGTYAKRSIEFNPKIDFRRAKKEPKNFAKGGDTVRPEPIDGVDISPRAEAGDQFFVKQAERERAFETKPMPRPSMDKSFPNVKPEPRPEGRSEFITRGYEVDGKEIQVGIIKFKGGEEIALDKVLQNIDTKGTADETPVLTERTILQVLDFVKEKNPTREEFETYWYNKRLNKGGAMMDKQMQMAFMDEGGLTDDGMDVDPVSGNDIPSGSMAEEVRDDIPAQLSDGEYVVPADVVRYYGVKFFEDLRERAKMGLQEMEMNGRIGGEPVPAGGPINTEELSPEEMQAIQEMMGMSQGGSVDAYKAQQELLEQPPAKAVGNPVMMSGGGQVRGYQDSSLVTSNLTEQNMLDVGNKASNDPYIGQDLGFSIFGPSSNQQGVQQTEVKPFTSVTLYNKSGQTRVANNAEEKAKAIADGYTMTLSEYNMYKSKTVGGGSGGSGITPPGEGEDGEIKPWGQDVNWNNVADIEQFVAQAERGNLSGSGRFLRGAGFMLAGLPGAALATAFQTGKGLSSLYDMKAAQIIAEAKGKAGSEEHADLANKIQDGINTYLKDAGGDIINFFYNSKIGQDAINKRVSSVYGKGYKNVDDWAAGTKRTTVSDFAASTTRSGKGAKASQNILDKRKGSGMGPSKVTSKTFPSAGGSTRVYTSGAKEVKAGTATADEVKTMKDKIVSSGGTYNVGGRNKGGLMTKGKKKK